jgi:hypothetical protein
LVNKEKRNQKDQFVQTHDKFEISENQKEIGRVTKSNLMEKEKKLELAKIYEENHDHEYLNKIKKDYRAYVRADLNKNKSNILGATIHDERENRYREETINADSKKITNFFSLNSKSAKKSYAEELEFTVFFYFLLYFFFFFLFFSLDQTKKRTNRD